MNASSLIGTTVITSGLGFVYWLVAARFFPPQVLGLASATISAMTLLGFFCTLGLGTLLMGELSRHPENEFSLISASLILVGGVGGFLAIVFAVVAPLAAVDFHILSANLGNIALFAVGVSLSAITLVLDGAFTGLLHSELQFWRNTLFALVKLIALVGAGLLLSHAFGMTIYATWAVGNALSLIVLIGSGLQKKQGYSKLYRPQWKLLRKLAPIALQHHMINVILDIPSLGLPLVVTIVLSATSNAWFYTAYMLAGFTFTIPFALSLVLFAMTSNQLSLLVNKTRMTVGLSFVAIVLANCLLQIGTKQFLGLFGHVYAEQAALSLHILGLAAFPMIIKNHYIAIVRIQGRMAQALLLIAISTLLELGSAALGGRIGGLSGLSVGWFIALCVESMFMFRTVYTVIRSQMSPVESEHSIRNTVYAGRTHVPEVSTNETVSEK